MIAVVTNAEKDQRDINDKVHMHILGYDPKLWIETEVKLRNQHQRQIIYHHIELPPPITGEHKFSFWQTLYQDVHNFISLRQWAPIDTDDGEHGIGGITWL